MANNEKSVYWLLPMSLKNVVFNTPKGDVTVLSLMGAEFILIKDKDISPNEKDVVVQTPYGKLIYRPKMSKTSDGQLSKSFNVTKTFCKKLYPKVTRKLFGDGIPAIYDFEDIEQRRAFMQKVLESNVILGLVGMSGKKGFLKRVTPITPLKELDKMEASLMESKYKTADNYYGNMTKLYETFELLIEKMSLVKDNKKREEQFQKFETLM